MNKFLEFFSYFFLFLLIFLFFQIIKYPYIISVEIFCLFLFFKNPFSIKGGIFIIFTSVFSSIILGDRFFLRMFLLFTIYLLNFLGSKFFIFEKFKVRMGSSILSHLFFTFFTILFSCKNVEVIKEIGTLFLISNLFYTLIVIVIYPAYYHLFYRKNWI